MNKIEKNDSVQKSPSHLDALKVDIVHAPVMAFLEKFDKFVEKKKTVLKKGEVLFEPGENPYLYIVASGALAIFRINPSGESKEVGKVYTGAFIGEGILSDRIQKDVQATSITENTIVVALDKSDIEYLESLDTITLARLYKHINNITSLRLNLANKELAIMYESTQKFQEFRELGQRGLLAAINHLKNSLVLDSILMIEEHPYVPGLLVYKYNTKFPSVWPINQKVEEGVDLKTGPMTGEVLSLRPDQSKYCMELKLGEQKIGYLVVARSNSQNLSDSELRTLEHIAPMIASMLRDIQHESDAKARALQAES